MDNKDDKTMEGLVDKMMEGGTLDEQHRAREGGDSEAGTRVKMDARTEPRDDPEALNKEREYRRWIAGQSKEGMPIGIKKIKKRK